jgi:hypothetical protein
MAKTDSVKKLQYDLWKNNRHLGKKTIIKRFVYLGYPKTSLYRWLDTLELEKKLERKVGSGRPRVVNIQKLKKIMNHKTGVSQRMASKKIGCTQPVIHYHLKKNTNIKNVVE